MAARRYGIPVTSITLFFLGGVAQIGRDAPRPMAEGVIAIAGPAVSIALGVIFFLRFLQGKWRAMRVIEKAPPGVEEPEAIPA